MGKLGVLLRRVDDAARAMARHVGPRAPLLRLSRLRAALPQARIPLRLPVLMLVVVTAACTPIYRDHGYAPTDADLAQVQVGQTREQVSQAIGYPVSTGVLTESAWYYVGSRWRSYGALAPAPVTREVVAISFTPQGRVSNIERFGLERGRVVVLSRRVTESNVEGISFINQLLRNVGTIQADQLVGDRAAARDGFMR